jgi:integrase
LLQAAESEAIDLKVYLWLATSTGARPGELTALTWSDIDLEKGTLSISKTAQTQVGKGVVINRKCNLYKKSQKST